MKKRIVVLFTCMCLGLSQQSVVITQANAEERMQECGNCGKMTLLNHTERGKWYLKGQQRCKKVLNQSDNIYKRLVKKGFKCSSCGYEVINSSYYEEKVECWH